MVPNSSVHLVRRGFMVEFISSMVAYVTNPKPLECLVLGSLITTQPLSVPHCPEWLLRLSSVVSKLKPPMKSFCSCSGSLGDSDLDLTVVGEETLTMPTRRHPGASPELLNKFNYLGAEKVNIAVLT